MRVGLNPWNECPVRGWVSTAHLNGCVEGHKALDESGKYGAAMHDSKVRTYEVSHQKFWL